MRGNDTDATVIEAAGSIGQPGSAMQARVLEGLDVVRGSIGPPEPTGLRSGTRSTPRPRRSPPPDKPPARRSTTAARTPCAANSALV